MITPTLLTIQLINGIQAGVTLFLMASGLTLVLGIMNFINLAHGSLFMLGAYYSVSLTDWTGSFLLGVLFALPATFLTGMAMEWLIFRKFYTRHHLDQVLVTFGVILFCNEAVRVVWGPAGLFIAVPSILSGNVTLLPGVNYPAYRLAILVVGIAVAVALYLIIKKTRLGMMIRAGADNREMVEAVGIDIGLVFTLVFGLAAVLAGLAGALTGPIFAVDSGMGDAVLILALVAIVSGGIGSVRGAFVASLAIGLLDTLGRSFLPLLFAAFFSKPVADAAAPAVSSMLIYLIMAGLLFLRPNGLFPARVV
jgi:branched-chain amino acid transport system permease protein